MKIQNQYKINQNDSVSKSGKKKSSGSSEHVSTEEGTQIELSDSAEVSRKSINAIENGIYVPSTVLALKITKTLGCKVEDLFKLP